MVPGDLLTRIRCPDCGAGVDERGDALVCSVGHVLPMDKGYLDALRAPEDKATRSTAQSFGYEWTTFASIEPEDEDYWATYFLDVPLETLADAVALDAGCGKGRYTYFLAPRVRAVVALESSVAVEAAVTNLRRFPNTLVVRADLRVPPFGDAGFDFVSCLGVLHHLTDPEEGFRSLVRLLAPGGRLLLYLYSRPERFGPRSVGLGVAAGLRRLSVRLPHPLLRGISAPVAAALYVAVVVPGSLGERLALRPLSRLPLTSYRGKPLRSLWLDTFDRLSAPVEHRYVWADIEPWFQAAGLEVERVREDAGLFILARRPPGAAAG